MGKFRDLRQFQLYLANTLNLEDSLELMNKYPEFNDTVHFDVDNIPLEDVKDKGMEATNKQIEFIKNSDHCLRDSFRTGEAISPKQYKEFAVNIGSKPDGLGSVFPHPIKHSFMNGGLQTPEEITVESSVGRQAQNLQKNNVGQSGAFARLLELNNQDTFLHKDPSYICNSKNFEEVVIENETILKMFDLRYYRENPNGIERLLEARKDKHLIGKKLYFRSPMCCDSAAKGHGVCYRCYGDLAYANQEVNIGQIAAEGLSSIYTQILLSAKHLLESSIIKMEWNPEFYDMFKINFNTIGLKSDFVFRGYKLMIDEDVKSEEAIDEINYNYYINAFTIITPQGEKIRMHTLDADNIYFVPEFFDIYSARLDQILRDAEDNNIDNPDTTMIFDIVELIRNYLQSASILIQQSEAQITFVQEEQVFVWGDEFKIEEVFMNYFTNALNHLDERKQIRIALANENGIVRVSVFNTGIPIPEDSLPHIWEKFYKVDKARTRAYGGSGVGLSIVKAIMESLHQRYGVCNHKDGVEFWFELECK